MASVDQVDVTVTDQVNSSDDSVRPTTTAIWFEEFQTEHFKSYFALKSVAFNGKTKWQDVQVIETDTFGKCLVLDGKMQSSQVDEFIYHETLVQPALALHPNPKKVYIGGGGELATAREVLRNNVVERCVMVDIDEEVVNMCREHLPEWGDGVCEDPRLDLVFGDAWGYLKDNEEKFDVIIMDICDPIDNGPGNMLYTEEFYKFAVTKLNPGGILVTMSGPAAVYNWHMCFGAIHNTLRTAFDVVVPFTAEITSFAGDYGFNVAFNVAEDPALAPLATTVEGVRGLDPAVIDQRLAERLDCSKLRFYDGISHRGIFNISKALRNYLPTDDRVVTMDKMVILY